MIIRRVFLSLLAVAAITSCDKVDSRREAVDAGDRELKAGAYRAAVAKYEDALDGTEQTAEIHYKIAGIYDDKLKEPLDAIHHYDRYLELTPHGSRAKEAKAAREDCEKRLQAKLSKEGFMTTSEAARLRNQNESLLKQIMDMRNPKTAASAAAGRSPNPAAPDTVPPGAREYTVAKGDTLATIALKFYKSRAMAANIKDANFNQLNGSDKLKIGQVLIIPEGPKKRNN